MLHHAHDVVLDPVLSNLAIGYAHDIDARDFDRLSSGGHAEEFTVMGSFRIEPTDYFIDLGHKVLGGDADVGETVANHDGPFFHAVGAR